MLRSRPLLLLGLLALALAAYRMWVVSRLGVDAFVDEAQYGDWGRSLAWGYYSKPPLIAALIAASSAVFGDGPLAIKLPAFVLYPATALLVCALGRHLFDARTGFLSGLVFLTLPLVSALGLFVSTDAPLLFFWAAGMWLLVLAFERGGGWWLALGACVGLGLMSKYAMLFFVASTACAIAWRRDGTRGDAVRGSLVALAVALLCVAPNLWWNAEHGFPTFEHVAHTTRGADGGWNPLGVLEFVGVQWLAIGPLVGGLTLLALPGLRRRWEDPRLRLLVAFALPVLAVVAFQALSGRVNGNWAAPALIPLVLLTVAHFAQRPRLVMLAMACNVMLAVALYQWSDLVRASGYELSAGLDPYKRARGWSALAEGIRPQLEAHPGAALLTADREYSAQLRHALRPARHFAWHAGGRIADHYALTVPLASDHRGELLLVTREPRPAHILERFDEVEWLATVSVPVHSDYRREASVWRVAGFRGY